MEARSILLDDGYTVPEVERADRGVQWLRAHVVRFSEGENHRRRRRMVEEILTGVEPASLERSGDHVATLAAALGIPRSVARDVHTIAASYQPHTTVTPEADAALARLVQACGGSWDEHTANVIGILVQSDDATAALAAGRMPPVPSTRRITSDGDTIQVPLDTVPFGAGRHECPARMHAEVLASAVNRFRALHNSDEPLILPNAWDVASATLFADAGFAAVGTTSLGVAAANGVPDASGLEREATMRLAAHLVHLPVPITVDIAFGWGPDLSELAAHLFELGIAGVNIEDGRGAELERPDVQAAAISSLKAGAVGLFVNARIDTYWLGTDHTSTLDRARCYISSGADGIFVPGLADDDEIAHLTSTIDAPLNLLAGGDVARLRDLGVRRISTGSLPYRVGLAAALGCAVTARTGTTTEAHLSYDEVNALARPSDRFDEASDRDA